MSSDRKVPVVYIVMPAFNEEEVALKALHSSAKQTVGLKKHE